MTAEETVTQTPTPFTAAACGCLFVPCRDAEAWLRELVKTVTDGHAPKGA